MKTLWGLAKIVQHCSQHADNTHELDLKHFLSRPSEHLQKYPLLFEAIQRETADGDPDQGFLSEAIKAMKYLEEIVQLRIFQSAMGKGPTRQFEWYDLVSMDLRAATTKQEAKRQMSVLYCFDQAGS
jgi:hypothetical protein